MAMPCVEHRDAAGEVDVAAAFDVPEFGVGRACDEDFMRLPDAANHCRTAALHQCGIREVLEFGVAVHGVSFGRSHAL